MGPTTLYGHAERGRSNRKVCLLFNRRRVHKGENYIWQGWEVPNAENSACPLRSRRKSAAHHYKISSDDQGNPTRWGPRYPTVDLLFSLPKDIDLTRRLDGRRLIVAGSKNSPSSCPSSMQLPTTSALLLFRPKSPLMGYDILVGPFYLSMTTCPTCP